MDCDRFERVLMDLLYNELDELTAAAAHRHADHCQRCRGLQNQLRTTREVGLLPLEEPPSDFEAKVLAAERQVHRGLPLRTRLARSVTIFGGYAMRPQIAMAALALLMIGSSLVFLRPKPGSHASNVQVTERGLPRPEPEEVVVPIPEPIEEATPEEEEPEAAATEEVADKREQPPEKPEAVAVAAAAPAPSAEEPAPPTEDELDLARQRAEDRAYTAAMAAFQQANHLSAQQQFDAIVASGGQNAPAAELYAALATEEVVGCAAALPRFDSVAAKFASTHLSHTATWHSASCRAQLGRYRRAALDFERLLKVPAYAARARTALARVQVEGAPELAARPAPRPPEAESPPASNATGEQQKTLTGQSAEQDAKTASRKAAAKPSKTTKKSAKKKAKTQTKRSAPKSGNTQ